MSSAQRTAGWCKAARVQEQANITSELPTERRFAPSKPGRPLSCRLVKTRRGETGAEWLLPLGRGNESGTAERF